MIVFESREVRRLVGRIEREESLLSAFERLARERGVRSGFLTGRGALSWVELREYDQHEQCHRAPRRIDTPCELLSLVGNISEQDREPHVEAHVTLSRETDNGIEVIGGQCVAAGVFACEFVVEAYDDISLVREHDEATGLSLWMGRSTQAPRATSRTSSPTASGSASTGISWAQVAEVSESRPEPPVRSARMPRPEPSRNVPSPPAPSPIPERRKTSEEEFLSEFVPEKGDWVDHRQFGLCRVDGDDPQGGLIIRLPSGVRKTINLDYLEVLEPRVDEGRRVFPLRPRRSR